VSEAMPNNHLKPRRRNIGHRFAHPNLPPTDFDLLNSALALFFLCQNNRHHGGSTQMLQSRCLWAADRVILRLLFAAGAWGAHSCEPALRERSAGA
jgi:hypothetical protein